MKDAELRRLLDTKFDAVAAGMRQLDVRMDELEKRLDKRIDSSAAETRAYARELVLDARHQFGILVEDLRHKLEFTTEHVLDNSASIKRLEAKIDEGLLQHDLRITRLEAASPH